MQNLPLHQQYELARQAELIKAARPRRRSPRRVRFVLARR